MGASQHSPEDGQEPTTVREWVHAVVNAPSGWDLALATVPVAITVGVMIGGTTLSMWTGVALGLGIVLAAIAYVVASDAPR